MRRILVLAVGVVAMLALAAPVSAGGNGAVQLSGLGEDLGPCGLNSQFDITITGTTDGWSLDGCLGQTFGPSHETPAGNFLERGTEVFEGCLWLDGVEQGCGTFETTYLFTGKFDADGEIFGRCQHPITESKGFGIFDGATGRLDFKDDVDAGNFVMRGHIKLANGA